MKKVFMYTCFLFIMWGVVGCGSTEQNTEIEESSVDAIEENKSILEEIKEKAEQELSLDNIFVPEMDDLEVKNAFVSFSGEESFALDIQYHAQVTDKDKRFENEIIVEEHKQQTGMKYLVPPYVNSGDMYFWFVFSKLDMPEMLNSEEDGIDEEWIEIDGNGVLFVNNGTNYNYYTSVDKGHYRFSYNVEYYSQEETETLTKTFISEI